MTTTTERPAPPRRPFTLIIPVFVAAVAMFIGGLFAPLAQGVIWGAVGAAGVLLAFRLANVELDTTQQAVAGIGVLASAVLSTVVLPDLPESVTPTLSLRFGAAWIPAAAAFGYIASQKGSRPSTAVNLAVAWFGTGVIALAASQAFNVLVPVDALGPVDPPQFGGGDYAFIGLIVGLLAVAATFSAIEHLPSLSAGLVAIFFTAYAGAQVGFSPFAFVEALTRLGELPNKWPIDWDWAIGEGEFLGINATNGWDVITGYLIVGAIALVAATVVWRAAKPVQRTLFVWLGVGVITFFLWLPSWQFGNPQLASPILETFRIAIVASVIGTSLAVPVAFMASKVTSYNTPIYLANKGFMNLIRTVPDLFWALLFVASLGIGPFGGALALTAFALAIMAKLFSETIDAVDPGPLEAAKSTGSKHLPAIRTSVMPQVLPNYVAYALYVFEINIRASVVLGLVGAGGIGRVLEAQRAFFRFDRVIAIVAVIFVIVFVIEQVSVALRRRLV